MFWLIRQVTFENLRSVIFSTRCEPIKPRPPVSQIEDRSKSRDESVKFKKTNSTLSLSKEINSRVGGDEAT